MNGTQDNKCQTTSPTPNITTEFSFFRRQGTLTAAKANLTILEVTNLTAAELLDFSASDLEAYRSVLSWLLDYSGADIPAPSAIIENFWTGHDQLQDAYSRGILHQSFRSILVFPLWLFNANNYGNAGLDERVTRPDLPPEFYTTASLVRPYVKIKFDATSTYVFIVFQGVALLWAWGVLVWLWTAHQSLPEISSFPLFDVEFKAEARDHGLTCSEDVWRYQDSQILDAMSRARVGRKNDPLSPPTSPISPSDLLGPGFEKDKS
jgi:hypothetical protein